MDNAQEAKTTTELKQVEELVKLAYLQAIQENINVTNDAEKLANIKTAVFENLANHSIDRTKYSFNITIDGATVTEKGTSSQQPWELSKEIDETTGLITALKVKQGKTSFDLGTEINYMPEGIGDTNYTGGWKILGVDSVGRLQILSNTSVTGDTVTIGSDVSFEDTKNDYKNALDILQENVNSYKDGVIGEEVRSITIEDIDYLLNPDKTRFGNNAINKYNTIVTFKWNGTANPSATYGDTTSNLSHSHSNGFVYYDPQTNDVITANYSTVAGTEITTLTTDLYTYKFSDYMNSNIPAYSMLNGNATYYLASRYTLVHTNRVNFGLRNVSSGAISYDGNFTSTGVYGATNYDVRAVVTLSSDIQLVESLTKPGTYDIEI